MFCNSSLHELGGRPELLTMDFKCALLEFLKGADGELVNYKIQPLGRYLSLMC